MRMLLALAVTLVFCSSAAAQNFSYSTNDIGQFRFYNGDISGSRTRIGDHTFYNGDISGSSTRIGNHSFHHFTDPYGNSWSGSSTRIGGHSFHNFRRNRTPSSFNRMNRMNRYRFNRNRYGW